MLQIEKMSLAEKLQAMEALWADLSKNETQLESPQWHNDILKETAARVAAGQEQILDWPEAKQKLRKRFEIQPDKLISPVGTADTSPVIYRRVYGDPHQPPESPSQIMVTPRTAVV